ncbi:YbfB/YjiJ family MFS transporter [Georgenia wutianyii]|uniref:YbfB/YjiJ family MFS transporter n=1 Tax=Georgenia wutianyii TaxID=2585135 RepID=A0ABX5VIU3_9MICO|nr:MFS transporter [Georgenia wutianyii]QDB78297.1 YbfB/YjiJ family MFS transporter [Georgenia wutianyii]
MTVESPAAHSALSPARTRRLTAAGLALIAVSYGLARFSYGLFVPAFRAEFGLDAAAAGAVASASYAAYCLGIVLSTTLTPRWGGRLVAVLAGAVATAGTLTVGLAPSGAVLAVGVVVGGASTGLASPPLAHAVAASVAEERRSRAQAVVNAGTGVGVAVAGPVALAGEQWRAGWLAFAALCAVVTVWAALAVPTSRPERAPLLPRPLLPRGSGRLAAAALLAGAASAATWTFGRDVLVEGGMSVRASTVGWILLGVFGVLGAAAGDLIGRLGLRRTWPVTMLAMAGATALLALVPGTVAVAWPAATAFGAAYIAMTGVLLLWTTRLHPRAPAAGVGLAFLLLALGQSAGAPLVGALAGATDLRVAFAAAAAVAVVGCLTRPGSSAHHAPAVRGQDDRAAAVDDRP